MMMRPDRTRPLRGHSEETARHRHSSKAQRVKPGVKLRPRPLAQQSSRGHKLPGHSTCVSALSAPCVTADTDTKALVVRTRSSSKVLVEGFAVVACSTEPPLRERKVPERAISELRLSSKIPLRVTELRPSCNFARWPERRVSGQAEQSAHGAVDTPLCAMCLVALFARGHRAQPRPAAAAYAPGLPLHGVPDTAPEQGHPRPSGWPNSTTRLDNSSGVRGPISAPGAGTLVQRRGTPFLRRWPGKGLTDGHRPSTTRPGRAGRDASSGIGPSRAAAQQTLGRPVDHSGKDSENGHFCQARIRYRALQPRA